MFWPVGDGLDLLAEALLTLDTIEFSSLTTFWTSCARLLLIPLFGDACWAGDFDSAGKEVVAGPVVTATVSTALDGAFVVGVRGGVVGGVSALI